MDEASQRSLTKAHGVAEQYQAGRLHGPWKPFTERSQVGCDFSSQVHRWIWQAKMAGDVVLKGVTVPRYGNSVVTLAHVLRNGYWSRHGFLKIGVCTLSLNPFQKLWGSIGVHAVDQYPLHSRSFLASSLFLQRTYPAGFALSVYNMIRWWKCSDKQSFFDNVPWWNLHGLCFSDVRLLKNSSFHVGAYSSTSFDR